MADPTQAGAQQTTDAGLRAMLEKARAGLANGLWDYGPGQDEHEQCDALIAEIDAMLAASPQPAEPDVLRQAVEALEGVVRVADRATVEFDAARAAIASLRSCIGGGE